MRAFQMAILATALAAAPAAAGVWTEGEAFHSVSGVAEKWTAMKPLASKGAVLFGAAMRRKGNEVVYRLDVPEPIEEAKFLLRYARGAWTETGEPPSKLTVEIESDRGSLSRELELPFTGGWGGAPGQWRWLAVEVGTIPAGTCTVRFRSRAQQSDISLDGFYLLADRVEVAADEAASLHAIAIADDGYLGVSIPADRPGFLRLHARRFAGELGVVAARYEHADGTVSPPFTLAASGRARQSASTRDIAMPDRGLTTLVVSSAQLSATLKPLLLATEESRMMISDEVRERIEAFGDVLATLRQGHPRLILTDERLADLKARYDSEPAMRKILADILATADEMVDQEPVAYELIGPRLLNVSRRMWARMYALGVAYRWTGERKYFDAAVANLDAACAFEDWHPSHFLDTAEMTHAVAIGYDWLYAELGEARRERIRLAILEKGLIEGMKCHAGAGNAMWVRATHNWNQVCNGGLAVGALAVGDTDADIASALVALAAANMPIAIAEYGPDGAWGEGPGYWGYATRYTVFALASMETALGKDFGLSEIPGFDMAGDFPLLCAGPTGMLFNYADSGDRSRRGPLPSLLWLGRRFEKPWYIEREMALIEDSRAKPRHLIWYPDEVRPRQAPPLDKHFRGRVPVVILRGGGGDDALWLAIKAGDNQINHGHLDLGGFEFDAMGVRWARDLGSDDYNLPGYWDRTAGGQRWSYYRNSSLSHSVPLLDGADQDALATAEVVAFESTDGRGHTIIDLTKAYAPKAASVRRGAALVAGRSAALIQDEFDLKAPAEVTWAMTTDATIDVRGDSAVLTLDGKRLAARVLAPAGATFSVESAERDAPEKTNEGVRRLLVEVDNQQGPSRVAVLLAPEEAMDAAAESVEIVPLDTW